jgi:hypothetical protein
MKIKVFIITMILAVLLCGVCGCSGKGKTDISGNWKGDVKISVKNLETKKFGMATKPIELQLAQTDKTISGKFKLADLSSPIDSGIIVDKTISIKVGVFKIDAKVNGNYLEGTMFGKDKSNGGKGPVLEVKGTFKAKKMI